MLDTIQRDPDVLAPFSRTPRTFPEVTPTAWFPPHPRPTSQALAGRTPVLADRRTVVADRRRDADGRSRARDQPPQPHPRHRRRHGARRGRRHAHRSRRGAAPARAATIRRRRRSWAPIVGGTIATNAAGAATFKYGTTRDWVNALTVVLPTATCSTSSVAPSARTPTATSRSRRGRGTIRVPVPRYRMPQTAEAVGRLLRGAGMDLIDLFIGCRRHARRRHRGDAARAAGQAGDVPGVRAVRAPGRRAGVRPRSCATWRATPGARTTRTASTCRPSNTWTRAACELLREDGIDRQHGVTIPAGHGDGAPRHAGAAGRHVERPRVRGHRERARRRRARHPARALLPAARRRGRPGRRRDRGAGRRRAGDSAARGCARPCRRPSTSASAARSRRSTRGSKRPPPT